MRRAKATCMAVACAAMALACVPASAQTMRTYTAARGVTGERQLLVTLDFGAGVVRVRPASTNQLYRMQLSYDADRFQPVQQYDARTGILRLGVESVGKGGVRVTSRSQLEQTAEFAFSSGVPLSLSANLGASEAFLDLGGLTLTDLNVRSGASRGMIDFSKPTRGECRSAAFSVGATELTVMRLANAGCRTLRIEGGVGRVTLDFSGTWRSDTRVAIEMSMGVVTLRIPRGTGVQLVASRFLSSLSADGFEKDGNTWTTPRFGGAKHKITVDLNTAVAGIDVEWID